MREQWISEELANLETRGLYRNLATYPGAGGRLRIDGREVLNFTSNDYLNLARHPAVLGAARRLLEEAGGSAAASRLVSGTMPWHGELEQRLAAFKGYPAALVYGSGYLTNLGVIPALVGRGDAVFIDRLAHASLVDGAVLSRAALHRFRHNDSGHLAALLARHAPPRGRALVVTESVFSMDGDIAPLAELARIAAERGALLMVDEAHATGVFGPGGSGLVRAARIEGAVNVSMGTLSKALGGHGGFAACSTALRELLINRSRAFIYTTALPPAVIGAALGALDELARRPDMGSELLALAEDMRRRLCAAGLDSGKSNSPIIPIMVGDNRRAVALAGRLRAAGILVAAIRPPTVPEGTARLRLSLTLAHTAADLALAVDTLAHAAREEGLL
jgi:8-amino-7-oxononanoate synthase